MRVRASSPRVVRDCAMCLGRGTAAFLAAAGGCAVHRCAACCTETVHPAPTAEALRAAYQNFDAGEIARDAFEAYVAQARLVLGADLAALGIGAPSAVSLLDYGCGGGHFVAAARSLGLDAVGIDIDEEDARFGRARSLPIAIGDTARLAAAFGERRFNLVLMMHVLEHLPDPAATLAALVDHLEPGGALIVRVPDQSSFPSRLKQRLRRLGIRRADWGFVQPPVHLHGFTPETFRHVALRHGLEVVRLARVSPLDPAEFPSSARYWRDLGAQRLVYRVGRSLGSGGHLVAILRKPREAVHAPDALRPVTRRAGMLAEAG